MGALWHRSQAPHAPLSSASPFLESSAILFSIRSINFWTLNPLHGINHCSQADNSSSPGAITPGFHSRRDWRLSLLAAIKLHSFSNYFVALLSSREFRGLAAFCAHRLPIAPYLQPRGPSIPPPLSALDMDPRPKCFLHAFVRLELLQLGWEGSVMFPVTTGQQLGCMGSAFWDHQDNWRRLYKGDTGKWGIERRGGIQRHEGAFASLWTLL